MRTVSNRGSHIKWQPILQGVAVGLRVPKRDLEQRSNIGGKAKIFIMRVLQQDWNFCLLYLLQQQCLYIIKKIVLCYGSSFVNATFFLLKTSLIFSKLWFMAKLSNTKKQHKPDSLQNQQNSQIQITNFIFWERKLHLVVSSNFSVEKT